MDKDRKAICEIVSEMLDNPSERGIYPTTRAYERLEELVEAARAEANGPEIDRWKAELETLKSLVRTYLQAAASCAGCRLWNKEPDARFALGMWMQANQGGKKP